ncbi:hypothetical protein Q3G72_014556 [Acer saccharum]|nr:hypothetical protein Q3G72_014556 [Acer saccharum]
MPLLKETRQRSLSTHMRRWESYNGEHSINQENLIGRGGGSGSVYRVELSSRKELAVKHIRHNDTTGRKRAGKSKQFDAEVLTLSKIRHINVVKLNCSITSKDDYMPNGSLWDRQDSQRCLVF